MIALIDYGMGNLGSVEKALQAAGSAVSITADPRVLEAADGLVLPGVGASTTAWRASPSTAWWSRCGS